MAERFMLLKVIGMAARAGMHRCAIARKNIPAQTACPAGADDRHGGRADASIAACCSERRPSRHGVSTPLINPFGSVAWPPAPV